MSVLIKGMEMPKNCGECLLAKLSPTGESLICNYMLSRVSWEERPFDCPLVPVPPHGRLIDADANIAVMMRVLNAPYTGHGTIETAMLKACIKMFEEAPTIIEAEEGELQKLKQSISDFYERHKAEEGET